jgi:hypothetical protein
MKVNIWIQKEEVLNGNITSYYTQIKNKGYEDYVQVSITADEFARLEDRDIRHTDQEYSQDNWNKGVERLGPNPNSLADVIYESDLDNASQANKTEGMIYERNPDSGEVYKRIKGDYDNREKVKDEEKSASITRPKERTASLTDMVNFIQTLNGGEFRKWYDRASNSEKELYGRAFEKLQDEYKTSK